MVPNRADPKIGDISTRSSHYKYYLVQGLKTGTMPVMAGGLDSVPPLL